MDQRILNIFKMFGRVVEGSVNIEGTGWRFEMEKGGNCIYLLPPEGSKSDGRVIGYHQADLDDGGLDLIRVLLHLEKEVKGITFREMVESR